MVLSAKLKLDTSQFAGPLAEAAISSSKVAQSLGKLDSAQAFRAAEAFRRLALDAASGRIQLSGTSNELLGLANGADKVAAGISRASGKMDEFSMKASKAKMLIASLGGMALNLGGAALEAYGQDKSAGYLKSMGSAALQYGLMIGMITRNMYATAGATVVGAGFGAGTEYFGNVKREKKETERLRQSGENLRIGFESTGRAIESLNSADQAASTLKKLREEYDVLKARMESGINVGDWPVTQLGQMNDLIDKLSQKEATLRNSENDSKQNDDQLSRSLTIGQSRDTLAAFKVSQSESASRQGFDKEFQSAKTSADRVALVSSRMDEFGAKAAELRTTLESLNVQADPEAFGAAFERLRTLANEVTRLQGLDTKVKAEPQKLLPSDHSAAIPTDSLARIGIFVGGAGNKMESIAERTARATAQSERHLRQMVAKNGTGRLVWG